MAVLVILHFNFDVLTDTFTDQSQQLFMIQPLKNTATVYSCKQLNRGLLIVISDSGLYDFLLIRTNQLILTLKMLI